MPKKFVLTYDEHYDADIERLLLDTPAKRRSERMRQLIRLGAMAEQQGLHIAVQPPTQGTDSVVTPTVKKPIRGFTPPSP